MTIKQKSCQHANATLLWSLAQTTHPHLILETLFILDADLLLPLPLPLSILHANFSVPLPRTSPISAPTSPSALILPYPPCQISSLSAFTPLSTPISFSSGPYPFLHPPFFSLHPPFFSLLLFSPRPRPSSSFLTPHFTAMIL